MQVRKFLSESSTRIRRDGLTGVGDVAYDLYRIFLSWLSRLDDGDLRAYDQEWDVLVVLDACRADLLAEVAPNHEFLPAVGAVRSAGSSSEEWLRKTFVPRYAEEMARTAHITGNPFSGSYLNADDFAALDEMWRHAWDDNLGTVHPEPITETAIHRWRTGDYGRMVVHYMQPHFPSIPRPEYRSGIDLDRVGEGWSSVWDRLRAGEVEREEVWDAYRANLEHVLDSVELLVTSLDADRVVVTADHGNSFGSWGLYGHPAAPIDAIRRVPWCELPARDVSGVEVEPPLWMARDREIDDDVEGKLRDLGYL